MGWTLSVYGQGCVEGFWRHEQVLWNGLLVAENLKGEVMEELKDKKIYQPITIFYDPNDEQQVRHIEQIDDQLIELLGICEYDAENFVKE